MAATKTVAQKLAIKPGNAVWTSHPDRFALVGDLPADAATTTDLSAADVAPPSAAPARSALVGHRPADAATTTDLSAADVALLFADDAQSARDLLAAHRAGLTATPIVWIAYPKANRTDINRDSLWPIAVEFGLRPNG